MSLKHAGLFVASGGMAPRHDFSALSEVLKRISPVGTGGPPTALTIPCVSLETAPSCCAHGRRRGTCTPRFANRRSTFGAFGDTEASLVSVANLDNAAPGAGFSPGGTADRSPRVERSGTLGEKNLDVSPRAGAGNPPDREICANSSIALSRAFHSWLS